MQPDHSTRFLHLVQTVVTLLEGRNPFNVDHCRLVAHYSVGLARRIGLDEPAVARLKAAAEMHTVGVLLQMEEKKPYQSLPVTGLAGTERCGREQPTHWREHEILQSLLGGVAGLEECIPVIVQRHEWFDGSGSLLGLAGDAICLEARVLAVADAFVDLATPKSHRDPVSLAEVLRRLREQAGTQFSPPFVEALAAFVLEEEEQWGAAARARRLDAARSRHWLALGNFYRQSGESEWALRCYRNAEALAETMDDAPLLLECVAAQFIVFCDRAELDRARDVLTRVRPRAQDAKGWSRQWYLLQWGILEWLSGNEQNAEQIVESVMGEMSAADDIAGRAAAMALLGHIALMRYGASDARHLRWLRDFVALLRAHDVFDVLVAFRPQTIPLLLSAVINDMEAALARNLLTRMGEPCHGALDRVLAAVPPAKWMEAVRAGSLAAAEALATGGNGESAAAVAEEPSAPTAAATPRRRAADRLAEAVPDGSNAAMRILCLGSLRVEAAGKTVGEDDWPTQKAMKLFVYLALRRSAGVPDQALMELFWPTADEERARNSLRNAVHQIRSVLRGLVGEGEDAPTLKRSRRTGLLSLEGSYFLDTEAVEAALKAAAAMLARGDERAAVPVLQRALDHFRGEFLENVRDDWAVGPRSRLAAGQLRLLDSLARAHLAAGDAEAAEVAARRSLAIDDLQEEGHVNLVEALEAQGRRTDALRHYQAAVVHFKREMGLDAPARLTQMYRKMMA